jgi:hypothetical protein
MPAKEELPSTLRRSPEKGAGDLGEDARLGRADVRGGGAGAPHRVLRLKHSYEKVGDHWEPKERKGPSDPQAARSAPSSRRSGPTAGGVDANASKAHLMDVARRLDVRGRSRMSKDELVEAIAKANDRESARSRRR